LRPPSPEAIAGNDVERAIILIPSSFSRVFRSGT
jgi:hypothetical protein